VYQYYYGRTGQRVNRWGIGASETAAVARLAALLGDRPATGEFVRTGWRTGRTSPPRPTRAWPGPPARSLTGLRAVLALGA
jgi:hypothetical protein